MRYPICLLDITNITSTIQKKKEQHRENGGNQQEQIRRNVSFIQKVSTGIPFDVYIFIYVINVVFENRGIQFNYSTQAESINVSKRQSQYFILSRQFEE